MSAIFAYAGEAPCKDIIIEGLNSLKGEKFELSGISMKTNGKIECLKIKGAPELLFNESKEIGKNSCVGLGEAACIYRCKGSGITSAPAANKLYTAVLDGAIENFEALKEWSETPFPIATDEDLLLALLTKLNSFTPLEIISKLNSSLGGNPGYAFISSDEDAVFAKSGNYPLFVGICESGISLSSELNAISLIAKKYYVLENGESCRITFEKVSFYDLKMRKIKKQPRIIHGEISVNKGYSFSGGAHSLPFTVRDTVNAFINDGVLNFDSLKFGKRTVSKIKRAVITGSGASFRAAQLAAYYFELMCLIPCTAIQSAELRYSGAAFEKDTLLIAVSAGGENKDALTCLRKAKNSQALTVAVLGNKNTSIGFECDRIINLKLSSKATPVCSYVAEITALNLFTLWLGAKNGVISDIYYNVAVKLAELLTGKVSSAIRANSLNPVPASKIINAENLYVTGLGADFYLSYQAAAEIRNMLSRPAFAFSVTDLTLENETFFENSTVVAFLTNRELTVKTIKYIRRIRSLGAQVILFTTSSIESEINDFENIIAVTDSLPLFDTTVALSGLENTLLTAVNLLETENKQKAV